MIDKEPIESSNEQQRFEGIARLIEGTLIDPEIEKVVSQAMVYDEYLRTFPAEKSLRTNIVTELDTAWQPWMKAPVIVTGHVKLLDNGRMSDEFDIQDAPGTSNGFNVVTFESEDDDGDSYFRLSRVTHDMYISGEHLGEKYESSQYHRVIANIDEVLVQTDVPSPERAYMWLQASAPYFLEEVDRRIARSRAPEESLLALRGLEVDASVDVDDDLTRNSAEVYLNNMIQLDDEVPYDLRLAGRTYQKTQSGITLPLFRQLHAISEVGKISVIQGYSDEGRVRWELATPMKLMFGDVSSDTIICETPLDTLVSIRSLRRFVLGSHSQEEI